MHRVLPPSTKDSTETAHEIVRNGGRYTQKMDQQMSKRIPKIARVYRKILDGMKEDDGKSYPLNFDFYGHRDFYSLISYS